MSDLLDRLSAKGRKYFGTKTCDDLFDSLKRKIYESKKQQRRVAKYSKKAIRLWKHESKGDDLPEWHEFFNVNTDNEVTGALNAMTTEMHKRLDKINLELKEISEYDFANHTTCINDLTAYNDFMRQAIKDMKTYADNMKQLSRMRSNSSHTWV